MIRWLKHLRLSLRHTEARSRADVERIAILQQAAVQRRMEYAAEQEGSDGTSPGAETASPGRKRVLEAEAAYVAALQSWDDKQFRR